MKLGEAINSKYYFKESSSAPGLISSSHNVGVEIEIEGITYEFNSDNPESPDIHMFHTYKEDNSFLPNISEHWSVVRDNSLRKGVEFIFNGPKKGVDIVNALNDLSNFFDVYQENVKNLSVSDRCSVHVHLDVRDLDETQLNRLLTYYILVERLLFNHVHPSRLKNNYCRPIVDSAFKFTLATIINNTSYNSVLDIVTCNCDKYSALNLLPLRSYGTVEFRHHQGTTNLKDILDWINIILSIKLLSQHDVQEINSMLSFKHFNKFLSTFFNGTPLSSRDFMDSAEVKSLFNKGYLDFRELINFSTLSNQSMANPIALSNKSFMDNFKKANGLIIQKEEKVIRKPKTNSVYSPPFFSEDLWQVTYSPSPSEQVINLVTEFYNVQHTEEVAIDSLFNSIDE